MADKTMKMYLFLSGTIPDNPDMLELAKALRRLGHGVTLGNPKYWQGEVPGRSNCLIIEDAPYAMENKPLPEHMAAIGDAYTKAGRGVTVVGWAENDQTSADTRAREVVTCLTDPQAQVAFRGEAAPKAPESPMANGGVLSPEKIVAGESTETVVPRDVAEQFKEQLEGVQHKSVPEPDPPAPTSINALKEMSFVELKSEAKTQGLSYQGNKATVLERLVKSAATKKA